MPTLSDRNDSALHCSALPYLLLLVELQYAVALPYNVYNLDIIKLCREKNWKLGKDIGLISYNDTAVKEVLEEGITVISTDFRKMGEEAANAILNEKPVTLRDPAKVIIRKSL